MREPTISLVIPNRNGSATIGRCLDAAYTVRGAPTEIIVVDDGSRDDTVALVEDWQKSTDVVLKLLVNPTNRGKGYSVRRGVQESCGRYLIFIDADLPYELHAIDDFLKALKSGRDLAVGSRVLRDLLIGGK